MADLIHSQLHKKIDYETTFTNIRTSLNLPMARIPMHFPSDRDALDFALGFLGNPAPEIQRIVWIRSTRDLEWIAVSEALARESTSLKGWRLAPDSFEPQFGAAGDFQSAYHALNLVSQAR